MSRDSTTEGAGEHRTGTDRRSVLKGVVAGAGLAFGTGAAVAGSGGPDGVAVSPSETTAPNPDVTHYRVADDLRAFTSRYDLLTLPAETVHGYVERADLDAGTRRAASDALVDLRRRYPVEQVRDGNVVRFTLADDVSADAPASADREKFATVATAFASGTASLDAGGDVGADWKKTDHERQAETACDQVGVGYWDTQDIKDNAPKPDTLGCNCDPVPDVPDWVPYDGTVENAIQNALDEVAHHFGQYYDPDVTITVAGETADLGGVGGCPTAGQYTMNLARNSSGYSERKYLGYAIHYVQDMGVPLHTGMGLEQANLEFNCGVTGCDPGLDPMYWLHSAWEKFARDHWDDLKDDFEGDGSGGTYYYYPVDSASSAIKSLAGYSSDYSYDVYHRVLDEGSEDWEDWSYSTKSTCEDELANLLNETGLWVRGYLEEFY